MKLTFLISFAVGIIQVFLLDALVVSVTSGKKLRALILAAVKFILYAVAIWLLVYKYINVIFLCVCGYAVGMPVCALLLFVYKVFFKKEKSIFK